MSTTKKKERRPIADEATEPVQIEIEIDKPNRDEADQVESASGTSSQVPAKGRAEPCCDHPLTTRIEVLLISTDRPLTNARLGALLALPGKGVANRVREAIEQLNGEYEAAGRSFRIEKLAGGWQILTRPQFGDLLSRLHQDRQQSRLSQAALETLSIVAYRQPIIRAEIEAVRGVAAGEVLRGLLERRLVKIVGRAEELGRPMLYGTTREFLKVFGLSNLDDLPEVEGLVRGASYAPPIPETASKDAGGVDAEAPAEHAEEPTTPEPSPVGEEGAEEQQTSR